MPRSPDDPRLINDGRRLAEWACASCHAIDRTSASRRPTAPPLRDILLSYPEDLLAQKLIDGVRVGHEDMPVFDFNVLAADALIAYLKSLAVDQPREASAL